LTPPPPLLVSGGPGVIRGGGIGCPARAAAYPSDAPATAPAQSFCASAGSIATRATSASCASVSGNASSNE
jgi:hypothetical protein